MSLATDTARVRRLINEPTTATYTDADIQAALERNLTFDSTGRRPWTYNGTALDPLYVTTYDVYRASAELWDEKAAALTCQFDYSGDGANMSLKQKYDNAVQQAQFCRNRACVRIPRPVREGMQGLEEDNLLDTMSGTGNS
jgi:hypothetical protein